MHVINNQIIDMHGFFKLFLNRFIGMNQFIQTSQHNNKQVCIVSYSTTMCWKAACYGKIYTAMTAIELLSCYIPDKCSSTHIYTGEKKLKINIIGVCFTIEDNSFCFNISRLI